MKNNSSQKIDQIVFLLFLYRVEVTNKANQTPNHWVYNDMILEDNLIVSNNDLIYPFAASQSTFNSYLGKPYWEPQSEESLKSYLKAWEHNAIWYPYYKQLVEKSLTSYFKTSVSIITDYSFGSLTEKRIRWLAPRKNKREKLYTGHLGYVPLILGNR